MAMIKDVNEAILWEDSGGFFEEQGEAGVFE